MREMKPTAILTADWHIRPDIPKCRTDDFFTAMDKKITSICKLAKKYRCPILIAGDLGEESQWPNWLLRWFIHKIKRYKIKIYVIPGQHDLPWHRLKHLKKSGIGVLGSAGIINLIGVRNKELVETKDFNIIPFPYGYPIRKHKETGKPMIAISHQLIVKDKLLWHKQKAVSQGVHLLKKFPEYRLILTGDNHNPFVSRYKNRLLVNPGSILRLKADQIKHRPRVYLWSAEENKVRRVYMPIDKKAVTRDYIDEKTERTEKMNKYIKRMRDGYKKSASYKKNLKLHFEENRTNKKVIERVMVACDVKTGKRTH